MPTRPLWPVKPLPSPAVWAAASAPSGRSAWRRARTPVCSGRGVAPRAVSPAEPLDVRVSQVSCRGGQEVLLGGLVQGQKPPTPVPQTSTQGLLPAVATGLTDQDRRRIEEALDRSVSANTRVMYTSAWRSLEDWARAGSSPGATAASFMLLLGFPDFLQSRIPLHNPLYRTTGTFYCIADNPDYLVPKLLCRCVHHRGDRRCRRVIDSAHFLCPIKAGSRPAEPKCGSPAPAMVSQKTLLRQYVDVGIHLLTYLIDDGLSFVLICRMSGPASGMVQP